MYAVANSEDGEADICSVGATHTSPYSVLTHTLYHQVSRSRCLQWWSRGIVKPMSAVLEPLIPLGSDTYIVMK
jgi:hypothetical protein